MVVVNLDNPSTTNLTKARLLLRKLQLDIAALQLEGLVLEGRRLLLCDLQLR